MISKKGLLTLILVTLYGAISFQGTLWLTGLTLNELAKKDEFPYGPLPATEAPSYHFDSIKNDTFGKFDAFTIRLLTREEFEQSMLLHLTSVDRSNLAPHLEKIIKTAESYQVDPLWILSIVMVESRFNPSVVSAKNAQGLMQITPETAEHLLKTMQKDALRRPLTEAELSELLSHPDDNLDLGIFYLKKLYQNFGLNYKLATTAYNWGPNKVKSMIEAGNYSAGHSDYTKLVEFHYLQFLNSLQKKVRQKIEIIASENSKTLLVSR